MGNSIKMGNCAGYCNGTDADDANQHQIKNSFNANNL